MKFTNAAEYSTVKTKLLNDLTYTSTRKLCTFNDESREITYITEEINPAYAGNDRIKVLLLFKNPHPDSVDNGLFFSEIYSQTFWHRFFEAQSNNSLLTLLKRTGRDMTEKIAKILLSGSYDSLFLYYFRCLYSFPTEKFEDLQNLFPKKSTVWKENLEDSPKSLHAYIKKEKIKYVIIFFKDGMKLLGGKPILNADVAMKVIKQGIDKYLCGNDFNRFMQMYKESGLIQELPDGTHLYFNINTRHKGDGNHLPKRYFTYNLEFILKDILKNSPAQNRQ